MRALRARKARSTRRSIAPSCAVPARRGTSDQNRRAKFDRPTRSGGGIGERDGGNGTASPAGLRACCASVIVAGTPEGRGFVTPRRASPYTGPSGTVL